MLNQVAGDDETIPKLLQSLSTLLIEVGKIQSQHHDVHYKLKLVQVIGHCGQLTQFRCGKDFAIKFFQTADELVLLGLFVSLLGLKSFLGSLVSLRYRLGQVGQHSLLYLNSDYRVNRSPVTCKLYYNRQPLVTPIIKWIFLIHYNKNTMIRDFAKQLTSFVRPAAFSTYKVKGNPPFKSQTQDTSKPKVYRKEDAERIYEQFLEENPQDPNEQSQKIISKDKASYNKEDSFSFDPYRVLGLTTGASKDKIDQAYRDLAVKYHPKNNSSFEAAERFIQISRAYEMLSPMKDTEKKAKSGYSVFMSDINNSVKDYLGFETKMKGSKGKNEQPEAKNAQVYTESKNYKRVGNDRQVVIEKEYNDNGKLIKFTQVENFKDDGTVEVTETFDDGTHQKLYKFTKNSKGQEIEGSRSSSDGDGNKA